MEEQDNFDAVYKWCNDCPCDSGLMELEVNDVWIFDHAEELRRKATSDNWPKWAIQTLEELIKEGKIQKSYQELDANYGKDASAFFKQIMALKAKWINCKLFRKSAAFKKQFGNSHFLIVESMWHSVVLQLTKLLTDKETICGHKVLTIERLAKEILDDNARKDSYMDRIKKIKELQVVKDLEIEWRHNLLAHINYEVALGTKKVSSINIDEVDNAIERFVTIFQELGRELGNSYDVSVKHSTIPDFAEEIARIGFDKYAEKEQKSR